MNKQLAWKVALIFVVLVASLLSVWPPKDKIKLGIDLKGGTEFKLQIDLSETILADQPKVMAEAIEIIRKRVDKFGVAEPVIQAAGKDRILVQLPGLDEKNRAMAQETLEKAAFLTFRLVHRDNDRIVAMSEGDPNFVPPAGYDKMTMKRSQSGRGREVTCYVYKKNEMTGKSVKQARVIYNQFNQPSIELRFDAEGAKTFARIAGANPDRQMAIVLDGELYSAPVIMPGLSEDARTSGYIPSCEISGSFTIEEAQQLANVLENPLEAPVKILEIRSVDPSLGRDSIESGVKAALIGTIAVVLFMIVYYLLAGVVADLAMIFNIIILIGVLAMFKFTLTLPGIAGIVLTIGMAVDANVLIYERIREELNAGKPLRAAIIAGYQRAFVVIFDSNFTTIMTALILIWLGSGPVKGFGVTLTIGLLANLFAAVFVTRLLFDWLVQKGWMKSFNMLHVFKHVPHINFLGISKPAFIASWLLIAAGTYSFVHRGGLNVGKGEVYGIDFKGGDTVTLGFQQKVDAAPVGTALRNGGFPEAIVQYQSGTTGEVLSLKLSQGERQKAVALLQKSFPNAGFSELGYESVGAVVGSELLKQALWAVAAALVGIMIYVAFRFGEFSYGLGALVSLLHDVLMTIAWFSLTGRTFSMPVVAALLTLIGYSINDTIVVFDRIRENKKLTGGKLNYFDLINRSVNETLSRTILTAGTVFLCAVALYGFGGRVLNDFSFCFVIGVLTGTYSSIYIASAVVLWWHRDEAKPTVAKA
jgi:SecD/SecF fusion protein